MHAEKQQVSVNTRTLKVTPRGKSLAFKDNRPAAIAQAKMIGAIQRAITPAVLDHIMQPHHTNGSPKGLHGYTGGALPNTISDAWGNINHVHQVWWRTPDTRVGLCKWSTMFPSNMNREDIEAVLKIADKREVRGWPRLVQPLKGHSQVHINIMKEGSSSPTYYPVLGTGSTPQSHLRTHVIGGTQYNVSNPL